MGVAQGVGELVPFLSTLWIPPFVLALVVIDVVNASLSALGCGPHGVVPVVEQKAFDVVVSRLERIHFTISELIPLFVRHELNTLTYLSEDRH